MLFRVLVFWLVALGAVAGGARAFDCSEAKCSEMTTCAEAHHKLTVCGHWRRDADRDGIPCENLCGKNKAIYLKRVGAQQPGAPSSTAAGLGNALGLISLAEAIGKRNSDSSFSCAGKRTCGQMTSCEEATFYLFKCGAQSLDGDGDGVPCNSLCR